MNRFYNFSGIVSGVAAGALFLVFFLVLQMSVLLSLGLGIAGFAGAYTFFYAFRPTAGVKFLAESGVTPELVETTLKEGAEKMKVLDGYARQIKNPQVQDKLRRINEVIRKIFENFRTDPKDIKYARQFLNYYLDTSIRIVKKYMDLSSQNLRSPEIEKTLAKAEAMLDSIEKAFEKQQAKLLRDDVMDLDVEIETLERTFNSEDLK